VERRLISTRLLSLSKVWCGM